ncbi:MAG TPA: threonine--tRNA ligase [Syntrophorhabdaceae bacterium]|nr:threonine--tRNA ligase [Syntrophorhabdaceae bacterium]MBV6506790.1 Threonine--tRNA ligase 2 [Syntrophorhabdaceae bacterium]HNQ62980.1 threonine--tRNA ligase [Syntrophorhabdaceae bacterium]HNZ59500.1 threonine--tRNA ligase [Syntrophorhabdaceae bacterium]HOG40603.1 threonine--tRNA ligase [Syntrophorhabdaceae bacterium]
MDESLKKDVNIDLDVLRHSTSHLMAQAVKELFPEVKVAIGPAIENGFYYDFDYPPGFTDNDLVKIEERMKEIVKKDIPIERKVLKKNEALDMFRNAGETYKLELIEAIDEDEVSIYKQGDFTDLCRGPHLSSTGKVGAFKLLNLAGAYWRGDEKNKMLTRIYGTAFQDEKSLDAYLQFLEEVKRRDHRRLGKELELFSIYDEVGAGLVVYHPKGAMLRYLLEDFERKEHLKRGYQFVVGPHILKLDMWKKSGHFDNYRDNMYFTKIDDIDYGIKPMNCLSHIMVYKSVIRSYRELPLRYFELGTVARHEKSGVLHGLMRVREFTQDDAHIFLRQDQLHEEILNIINFVRDTMKIFDFEYEMEISTRPDKFIGTIEDWDKAEGILKEVLIDEGIPFDVNEGDGAFYGPKIDIKLKDAIGRKWQCATIQCDFALPERFDLHYVDSDGKRKRPVMLHRVILGALERFMGVLIEHYGGKFPVWLSPVQVIIMNITDEQDAYVKSIYQSLVDKGIRTELDTRNEKLSMKIREGVVKKVPYMVIAGKKEMNSNTLTVRMRDGNELKDVRLDDFIERIQVDNISRR